MRVLYRKIKPVLYYTRHNQITHYYFPIYVEEFIYISLGESDYRVIILLL